MTTSGLLLWIALMCAPVVLIAVTLLVTWWIQDRHWRAYVDRTFAPERWRS